MGLWRWRWITRLAVFRKLMLFSVVVTPNILTIRSVTMTRVSLSLLSSPHTAPHHCTALPDRMIVWSTLHVRDLATSQGHCHMYIFLCSNSHSRGLWVCCYGIDLGASIVMFHQSEHSISSDLDKWEWSTLGWQEPWSWSSLICFLDVSLL